MSALPTASATLRTRSESDRSCLQTFVHRGHAGARAHPLLKMEQEWGDAEVGAVFDVCRNTVMRVRALPRA